jgi:hypothetical protein
MCNELGAIADLFLSLAGLMRRLNSTLNLLRLRRQSGGDFVIAFARWLKPEGTAALDVRAEARTLQDV